MSAAKIRGGALKFKFNNLLGTVYKGRPANGEGVVLKVRKFPDGGKGGGL